MPHQMKIATCSYCGSRQALSLSARAGHELACSACGAPLHEMKWLKPQDPDRDVKRSPRRQAPHGNPVPHGAGSRPGPRYGRDEWGGRDSWHGDERKKKKRKKKKSFFKDAFEEVFDVLEDIFD